MNSFYEELKSKAFSAFRALARECEPFGDANMLLGAADTDVSLARSKIQKTIDTEWIERIEASIPALDTVIRNPMVMIEDVDEVLPVELSKHITEKSIKHLAQHTNLILDVTEDDEVVPQKILNVFHEESYLTYENKFVNTLLSRLSAFVDKRLRALNGAAGIEMNYKFDYKTEFEHLLPNDGGRNSARINLSIELTSPAGRDLSESDIEVNERFHTSLNRAKRINMALISYRSSAFSTKLGKNYIRPPVIRTNAILKNKNLRELLNLWEYIEGYDKVGYSFIADRFYEMPSSDFVGGLYSSVALQYLTVYSAIADEFENNRLVSEKHLFEVMPEFDDTIEEEEIDDYLVYDSEYKKTVPVSRLMNNRKKLSEDEKKIRREIIAALKADEILNEALMREEAERRRLEREERQRREEEERRRREEEEARRLAEEEAKRLAEEEAQRLAAELAKREIEVRYRRSFTSRLIQTDDLIKDYYNEIKNELLSYKGVKARTSWSKESFKCGRQHVAKLDVKGKTLCVYLALDPEELDGTKYSVSVVGGDCPTLIKIKGERKKKHALELIAILMDKLGLARIDREAEDYHLPYEETEALIERGLIKVILPKGEVIDENAELIKADLSGLAAMRKDRGADDTEEVTEEEEIADTEDTENNADGELENGNEENLTDAELAKREIEVRYRRSFTSRLIQTDDLIKDYYNEIKNELLSYKGVKARTSWSKESFKCGRQHVAKLDVKGKTLCVYLALDPEELDGTKYSVSVVGGDCPTLIKIKGERKKKHALELIAILMDKLGLARIDREAEDYHLPYEETEALIERGLIKVILPKGEVIDENADLVKADLSELSAMRKDKIEQTAENTEEALDFTETTETEEVAESEVITVTEEIADPEPTDETETVDEIVEEAPELTEEAVEQMQIDQIENEVKFESKLNEIIKSSLSGKRTVLTIGATPLVSRGKAKEEKIGFAFAGGDTDEALIPVPYTREQYLALPRKKKKDVLMNVKALLRYAATARSIEALKKIHNGNERIGERIAKLEARLKEESRFLPTAKLWQDAVKRVTK